MNTANDDTPLLVVDGVAKSFGGISALAGVDLGLSSGEMRCIIGPNGAGKSTLFKVLTGQVRQDAGTIDLAGRGIDRLQPFARTRLGMSVKWQNRGVFEDLSVRHNLLVAMRATPDDNQQKRLAEIIDLASLRDREETLAKYLSHGEQQWLEIGMAVARRPRLLLLDEPTAGMSRDETRQAVAMLRNIHKEGVAVLVTEHDMEFVRQLACDITVLHQGAVFAQGSLNDLESHAGVRQIYLGSAVA